MTLVRHATRLLAALSMAALLTGETGAGVGQARASISTAPGDTAASGVPALPTFKPIGPGKRIRCENLDGVLLLNVEIHSNGKDTTGVAILDTGAGPLALDRGLLPWLDFASDTSQPVTRTPAPVTGFRVEGLEPSVPDYAYAVDLRPMREATGRPLLALAGAVIWRGHALTLDPRGGWVTLFPSDPLPTDSVTARVEHSRARLAAWLGPVAHAVPFDLRGDDKIVIRGGIGAARDVTWVLDTGATKTALFTRALSRSNVPLPRGSEVRGLVASTLLGDAPVRHVRLGSLHVDGLGGPVRADSVDAAVLDTPLADAMASAVGEPVHGLLGMSYLRRFRFAVDYGTRVLWLEPIAVGRDQRPYEYCTAGLQLVRTGGRTIVQGVGRPSPARDAGIRVGERLLRVDGATADGLDLSEVQRRLEGPPGSTVTLVLEARGRERTVAIRRRWLL
jgi:hypothetical protein